MGLSPDSKGLSAPVVAESARDAAIEGEELSHAGATKFRGVAVLANYAAVDRLDIQVAVSTLHQKMSTPTAKSWEALKRVA